MALRTAPELLRACSLLFLFRALAMTKNEPQRAILEEQIVALIGDLVPSTGATVVLGALNAGTLQPPYEALLRTRFRDAHDLMGSPLAPSWGIAPSLPRP